jgi:hypothetical protein
MYINITTIISQTCGVTVAETNRRTTPPDIATTEATIATVPKVTTTEATTTDTGEEAMLEESYNLILALLLLPENPSMAFLDLAHLSTFRHPELHPACGVPNLTWIGNQETILAQSISTAAPFPCSFYLKNKGPWTSCIIAVGFLYDSCANCHYGGSSIKYTLCQTDK